MTEIKPLLVRPPLLPEETLPSYLHRLAEANLLSSGQFEALVQSKLEERGDLTSLLRVDTFKVLANLIGLEPYKIFWASEHSIVTLLADADSTFDTLTVDSGFSFPLLPREEYVRHLRVSSPAQFCPHCLKEAIYQRRAWRAKRVAACIYHQCLLINRCPNCEKYLSNLEIIRAICGKCDYPLIQSPTVDLSHDPLGIDTQKVLYFWLNAGPHIQLPLPQESNRHLYLLAAQMMGKIRGVRHEMEGLHPIPNLIKPYIWRQAGASPAHTYVAWATAIQGLFNWPVNFHRFIEQRLNADSQCYTGQFLWRLAQWLTNWLEQWPAEKNQRIHQAIAEYLHDNCAWDYTQKQDVKKEQGYRKVTVAHPAFANFAWVIEKHAIDLLQVRREIFKQLIQVGLIGKKPDTASLPNPLVSRADVLTFYRRWDRGIPLCDVEVALHISQALACSLVNSGLLVAVKEPSTSGDLVWGLEKKSVNRLIKNLTRMERARHLLKFAFYGLEEATQILSSYDYDELKLIQMAHAREMLTVIRKGGTLGDVLFPKKIINRLAKVYSEKEDYISVNDFLQQFGINKDGLKVFVWMGLLSKPILDIYLRKSEVDVLTEKYLSYRETRMRLKIGKATIENWIASGALPVAVELLRYHDRFAYLFLKEDVDKLLPENRLKESKVRQLLKQNKEEFRQMVQRGEILPFSGPGIDGCSSYCFLREAIAEIMPHPFD